MVNRLYVNYSFCRKTSQCLRIFHYLQRIKCRIHRICNIQVKGVLCFVFGWYLHLCRGAMRAKALKIVSSTDAAWYSSTAMISSRIFFSEGTSPLLVLQCKQKVKGCWPMERLCGYFSWTSAPKEECCCYTTENCTENTDEDNHLAWFSREHWRSRACGRVRLCCCQSSLC